MEFFFVFGIYTFLLVVIHGRAFPREDCTCERRYYQHYVSKGCGVIQTDSCGCPTSFSCLPKNESAPQLKGCIYQNIEYRVGSKIATEDICQVCRCAGGDDPHIVCRHRECPQLDYVAGDNCHPVYQKNDCCPSRYECVAEEVENAGKSAGLTCLYGNVTYPFGAKIYSAEDPCLVCECDENWNGIENATCRLQECVFERNKRYLDSGCIPVYHESKCCPIEYYCPEDHSLISSSANETTSFETNDSCVFAGTSYAVGQQLPTNNSCLKCYCQVPPDVTCVHQSCPPPPNPENCYEFYTADHCCPVYDCAAGDTTDSDDAATNHTGCPTPMCADSSCVIGVLKGHECPTCICGDAREKNDLEPVDFTVESPFIKVSEDGGGILETPELDDSREVNNFEDLLETGLTNIDADDDVKTVDRELISEAFLEEVLEKEKNLVEGKLNTGAGKREPKSPFLKYELVSDDLEDIAESNSTGYDEEYENNRTSNEIRKRRSTNFQGGAQYNGQGQWTVLQQGDGSYNSEEASEREMESSRENYDEIKVFNSRSSKAHQTLDDLVELEEAEYNNVVWTAIVPGCPTPMCDNSSCRIGIPPGGSCPTCICRKRRQP